MQRTFADCGAQGAFINAGALRLNQDLAPGPVRRRDLEELVQYPTELHLVSLDAATLRGVLEHAVSGWPGQGHWLQVSGLSFRHGAQGRVSDVRVGSRPLGDGDTVRLVTTRYLLDPSGDQDGFRMLGLAQEVKDCAARPVDLKPLLAQSFAPALFADAAADGRICSEDDTACLALAQPAHAAAARGSHLPAELALGVLALLFTLPTGIPLGLHFFFGWQARRREVLGLFDAAAADAYFRQFFPRLGRIANGLSSAERARELTRELERHYGRHSGRLNFAIGGVLFSCLVWAILYWAGWTLLATLSHGGAPPFPIAVGALVLPLLPTLASAAFVGAYLWIATEFTARWRARSMTDLEPYQAVIRLLISVPTTYALVQPIGSEWGMALAVFLGAVPLDRLTQLAYHFVGRLTGHDIDAHGAELPVRVLRSADPATAERLASHGVTSIQALAYADPIVLAVRTQLGFIQVTSCINEALLWQYTRDKTAELAVLGLGGAQEVLNYVERCAGSPGPVHQELQTRLGLGAA
jgi:hypothetical protein